MISMVTMVMARIRNASDAESDSSKKDNADKGQENTVAASGKVKNRSLKIPRAYM